MPHRRPCTAVLAIFFFFLLAQSAPAGTPPRFVVSVVDAHGLAVAGAAVRVRSGGDTRSFVTGPFGSVRLEAEAPFELEVRAKGFEPALRRFESAPVETITVRLEPAMVHASVEVVVRDEAAALPAPVSVAVRTTAARTVFDALDEIVPGLSVTRRGVMGYGISTNGTGGVTIRGIGGQPNTGVLVVVDGRPEIMGLMGHPLPDAYSLSDAQAVWVTQGPASVLYGSNAMGGVVEIQARQPARGVGGRFSSSIGSFLTGQQRVAFDAASERGYFSIAAGVDHTRGDRPRSAYRGVTGTMSAGVGLSPSWKAALHANFTDFNVEDPGPLNAPLTASEATVERGGFSVTIDNASARTWGYTRGYASFGHHMITDGFRSVDSRIGVRLHQHVAAGTRTVVEIGSDISRMGGRARNIDNNLDYGAHYRTETAVFARAEHRPTPGVALHAGLRYHHDSLTGAMVVPEIGGAVKLNEWASVNASAARGFRSPTIRELYLFPAPNPELAPEVVWNYQASLKLSPAGSMSAAATVYYADVDNLIVTLGRFPNLTLLNHGRAINRGVEGTLRWRAGTAVELSGGYAYLRSTNLAPLAPAHKLTCAVDVRVARMSIHAGSVTVGRRWADASRGSALAGYTTVGLKATMPVSPGVSLYALVDNLLDRKYEVVAGYPMPGTNVLAGLTFSF